jgi:pheromone shutdown-related protein TraB
VTEIDEHTDHPVEAPEQDSAGAAENAPAEATPPAAAVASEPVKVADSDTVTVIERDGKTYYIVGTAHISEASVTEVRDLIAEVRPDTVCIELCENRYNALINDAAWKNLDIFKVIKQGKTLFLFANMILASYQKQMGEQLGVKPGAEFLAAVKQAEAVGARLILVDRDVHVTLKRTWANIRFWSKAKLIGMLLGLAPGDDDSELTSDTIESMKTAANFSAQLAEFSNQFPGIKQPFIDERDQYMISKIEEAEGDKVVAVVGALHVAGMRENFGRTIDRAPLELLPPPSMALRMLKWFIPLLILGAFSYGYYKHEGATLHDMIYAWVLPNSIMAALLTALARGKLLSIITAGLVSPITSLNPLLPAGVVVGLLEAWLRKPTVEDCEHLHVDIQTWRGILKNPVTHVLLVAVASTLGSALGAWIGLSWLIALVT